MLPTIEEIGSQNFDVSTPLALPEPLLLGRFLFSAEEGSWLFLDLDKPVDWMNLEAYLTTRIRDAGKFATINPAVNSAAVHTPAL